VDEDLGDLPRGERLRLDGADHLLAPAVAHERVADADLVRLLATAVAGGAAALVVVAAAARGHHRE